MTRCPNCGRENASDADFCVSCGFSLRWSTEEDARPDETPQPQVAATTTDPASETTTEITGTPWPAASPTGGRRRLSSRLMVAVAIGLAAVVASVVWLLVRSNGSTSGAVPAGDGVSPGGGSAVSGTIVWTAVNVRPGPNTGAVLTQLHKGDSVEIACATTGARNFPVVKLAKPDTLSGDWIAHEAVTLDATPGDC